MDDVSSSASSSPSQIFSNLPLSPSPTIAISHSPSTFGYGVSAAVENNSQNITQQNHHDHHHHPTFSRHLSFNVAPAPATAFAPGPAVSRLSSFQDPKSRRALDRIVSMDRRKAPEVFSADEDVWKGQFVPADSAKSSEYDAEKTLAQRELQKNPSSIWSLALSSLRLGYRDGGAKKLLILILLNSTYSSVELVLGLLSGRVGLVSDAFHLTFGCGLLSFSLIAMLYRKKAYDGTYTYGYKRLEVLAAFTNALFLLFLSFSLAVEALHAFVQDESEHKHYLIVSAVTNLFVNLLGVWFFRSYARIRIAYRKAEDMNYHSIFLHVLADSIRSAGLILASWLLTLGVNNAETLCLGLVAVAVFLVVMPLFKATAGVLLQMSPASISASILHKCLRQVKSLENVLESQARFWEMVPGFVVGTLLIQVKAGTDEQKVLQHVHSVYNDIGIKDLTVQIDTQL